MKRNINNFPTIYGVTLNDRIKYVGNRNVNDMFKFIKNNYSEK